MASSDLPKTMKAQVLTAFNTPYELQDQPVPSPTTPHDLLIKVEAASYCHTDAVLAAGQMKPNPPTFPHVGCHEFAGTVVQLGPSYAGKYAVGDRVGAPGRAFHPCGACFECNDITSAGVDSDPADYSVYCPRAKNNGLSAPGGFREYAVVDTRQVAPVPEGMTAVEVAPLMCAGITIYAALKKCNLRQGQRVAISGCGGGLGHLGLQFAAKMGFKVLGIDASDSALQLAEKLGTGARIVDARKEKTDDIVTQLGAEDGKQERGHMGVDAVIILPEAQKAFDYGCDLLRNHGTCVIVSFPSNGFVLSPQHVVFRDISFVGSLVGSNKQLGEMLQFAAQHNIRAVTKSFSLADLNELVDTYHLGRGGKMVVDMNL